MYGVNLHKFCFLLSSLSVPFTTKTLPPLWDLPIYPMDLSSVFIWGENWRWVTLQASRKEKMKTVNSKSPGKQLRFLDILDVVA